MAKVILNKEQAEYAFNSLHEIFLRKTELLPILKEFEIIYFLQDSVNEHERLRSIAKEASRCIEQLLNGVSNDDAKRFIENLQYSFEQRTELLQRSSMAQSKQNAIEEDNRRKQAAAQMRKLIEVTASDEFRKKLIDFLNKGIY